MSDPAAVRLAGALVFSALLAAVLVEADRAAEPVKAAEEMVAMIRDRLDRPQFTHP